MKDRYSPNTSFHKIARSIHEATRDEARRIATTPEYTQSRRERTKVEMLFAHLKRILKLDRLRLRGLTGAHDEFLLAATHAARQCARNPRPFWHPTDPLLTSSKRIRRETTRFNGDRGAASNIWIAQQLCQLVLRGLGVAWTDNFVDNYVVNTGFDGGCHTVSFGGRVLALLQGGRIQSYLRIIGVALIALVIFLLWGAKA